MANYEDLLMKNKKRIAEIKQEPKKLTRNGPKRPWQVNLSDESPSENKQTSNAPIEPTIESFVHPTVEPVPSKMKRTQSILESQLETEQIRNSSVTVPELETKKTDEIKEQVEDNKSSKGTYTHNKIDNTDEFRNNSGTVAEQNNLMQSKVPEQLRNCSVTKSGPIDQTAASSERSNDSTTEKTDHINKEQKFRNNSVTIQELNESEQVIRNNHVTGTGTVTEQINVYSIPKSETAILGALVNICINTGSTITPKLSYEKLSELSGVPLESCKTLVKRLERKGFLRRLEGTSGPGAWKIFEIPRATYQAFITYSQKTLNVHMATGYFNNSGTNPGTNQGTGLRTERSSSSNNIYKNITTTSDAELWKDIVIPEALSKHGFTETHAKQVLSDKENKLSVEDVQESFDNFAIDVQHNKIKVRTTHVAYLMSVLRGQRAKYISLFAKEQEKLQMEDYLTQLRQIDEDSRKQKLQIEMVQKYQEWMKGLSQEERNEIAKPTNHIKEGSEMQNHLLRAYFNKMNGIEI